MIKINTKTSHADIDQLNKFYQGKKTYLLKCHESMIITSAM